MAAGLEAGQAFLPHEGDVRGEHGVGIGRDQEAGLGREDPPQLLRVDVGEKETSETARDGTVVEAGRGHAVEDSFDELVAPAILGHPKEVVRAEQSGGEAHGEEFNSIPGP